MWVPQLSPAQQPAPDHKSFKILVQTPQSCFLSCIYKKYEDFAVSSALYIETWAVLLPLNPLNTIIDELHFNFNTH